MTDITAYRIAKDTHAGATRWKAYARDAMGIETTLGHYPTRKQAGVALDLLTGWRFIRRGNTWQRLPRHD